MKAPSFSAVATLSAALILSSCATTPTNQFANLSKANYRAVEGKSGKASAGSKGVVVARQRKASPAQVQVAVSRITNYIDSLSPEDKEVLKRKRYICVCTTQAPDSKGKVTCMAWDTQTQSFVGNNTYELVNPPPVPSTIQFQDFDAIFVGVAKVGVGA